MLKRTLPRVHQSARSAALQVIRAGFAFAFFGVGDSQAFVELWRREGVGPHSFFGGGIQSLGDQNSDGFDDWVVSSSGTGIPGQIDEPRKDLFHGGDPPSNQPYMTFKGRLEPYREVIYFDVLGDLNDDGFLDWWVQYYEPQDTVFGWKVEFHFGGPNADTVADGRFQYRVDGGTNHMRPLGDLNGDGHADWFLYEGGGPSLPLDRSRIFFGSVDIDTIPDLLMHSIPHGSQQAYLFTLGDINGDGLDDVLGGHDVYLGSMVPDTIPDFDLPLVNGIGIGTADVNSDGADDLCRQALGSVDVYYGGTQVSSEPDYVLEFSGCDGGSGPFDVSSAGDFNDDGYEDIVAWNPDCMTYGIARVYLGGAWMNPEPIFTINVFNLGVEQIWTAVGVGDINNDGVDDLAIGATGDFTSGQRGEVVIISGDTSYHVGIDRRSPFLPSELQVSVYPNPANGPVTVDLDVPFGSHEATVTLFNVLGQQVYEADYFVSSGRNRLGVDVSAFSSGLYLVQASCEELTQLTKLVILK